MPGMTTLQAWIESWRAKFDGPKIQEKPLTTMIYKWEDYELWFFEPNLMTELLAKLEADPGHLRAYMLEKGHLNNQDKSLNRRRNSQRRCSLG